MAEKITTDEIWLFGEMEIDPKLTYKEMLAKAEEISGMCGYLTTTGAIGRTKLITIHDNAASAFFRLEYNMSEPPLEWGYSLTKITEWRRGKVWMK